MRYDKITIGDLSAIVEQMLNKPTETTDSVIDSLKQMKPELASFICAKVLLSCPHWKDGLTFGLLLAKCADDKRQVAELEDLVK